jgi:hypothetical protein
MPGRFLSDKEAIMSAIRNRRRSRRPIPAFVAAALVTLAGLTFGAEQSDARPSLGAAGTLPGLAENPGLGGAGQIPPGSELALDIARRSRISVITQSGKTIVRRPVILSEGVAGRDTSGATDLSTLVPWNDIRAITVFKVNAGKGALVGAGAGVGLGVILGLQVSSAGDYETSGGGIAKTLLTFGGIGAGAGFLIGALTSAWETVYVGPGGRKAVPRISLSPGRRGGMMVTFSLSL